MKLEAEGEREEIIFNSIFNMAVRKKAQQIWASEQRQINIGEKHCWKVGKYKVVGKIMKLLR